MKTRKTNRSIRVFVSSTFRDMMAERDYLAKFIFPQLRKICAQRGVTWGEVDLRWGIPDEDKDDVIAICLDEIQRCHPYFIGLLGERYGYVPDEIPPELIEKYPAVASLKSKSVTELEMRIGCLAQEELNPIAHFYFRDPKYLDRLPKGSNRSDFETASRQDKLGLAQLKQDIRNAERQGGCFLREDYRNVQELGEWIFEDFTRILDKEFPPEQIPDSIDQEVAEHILFAGNHRTAYVQRPSVSASFDKQIASRKTPIVVVGESGFGKSAFLANWYFEYSNKHPNEFSLIHFIGSTGESTEPTHILRRIMLELKRHPKMQGCLPDKIPVQPESLQQDFQSWIALAALQIRVTLILDGLNYLGGDGSAELGWLPENLPANCCLILSTTVGRSLDIMRRRGWAEISLPPLSIKEREKLLTKYFANYSRRLSPARVTRICEAEQTSNPLFLRTLLEELRQFGEHERLGKQIEYYLQSQTITQLFASILQRLEKDYQPEKELVRKSLSWIACARRGLSESELLEMLGDGKNPMPMRFWTPFSLAIEPFMVRYSGLLNFATPYFRQTVEQRYFSLPKIKQESHQHLAAYFALKPIPASVNTEEISYQTNSLELRRVLDELPWQEAHARAWQGLVGTLTLMSLFAVQEEKLEWLEYWQMLRHAEANGEIRSLDIPAYYQQAFQELGERQKFILAGSLGQFLMDAGFSDAAEEYFRYELEHYPEDIPAFIFASTLNDQAQILVEQGRNEQALVLFEEAETLLRDNLVNQESRRCMASVLMNRANLMRQLGENTGAESRLQEALNLMKETTGPETVEVATVLQSLGNSATASKDFQRAHDLHQQAYEIRLKCLGPLDRDVGLSLHNIANLLQQERKFFRAMEGFQRAAKIFNETLGIEHSYSRGATSSLGALYNLDYSKPESNFGLVLLVLNTIPKMENSREPNSSEHQRQMTAELEETLIDHWDEMLLHETTIPILLICFPGFENIVASVLNSSIAQKYPDELKKVIHIPAFRTSGVALLEQMLPLLKVRQEFNNWLSAHTFQLVMVKPFANYGAQVDRRIFEHYNTQKPPDRKGIPRESSKNDPRPVVIETVPFDGLDGPITGLYKNGIESRPALVPSAGWKAQNYKPQSRDTRATGTLYFNLPLASYCLQGTSVNGLNALEDLSAHLLLQFAASDWWDQPKLFEYALQQLATVLKIQVLGCGKERGVRGYRISSMVF